MAKRFTDDKKWRNEWFRTLSLKAKLTWTYLCDECCSAGIWKADYGLASFQLDFKVTAADLREWFGHRVHFFGNDSVLLIPFFGFQYGSSKETWSAKARAKAKLESLGFSVIDNNVLIPESNHSGPTVGVQSDTVLSRVIDRGTGRVSSNLLGEKTFFETQAEQQAAFLDLCNESGLVCQLEVHREGCRFDAVVMNADQMGVIIEFKKYLGRQPRTDTKQLARYQQFGVPVWVVARDVRLNELISDLKAFFGEGKKSRFEVPRVQTEINPELLDAVYACYPLKKGRSKGLAIARREITTPELLKDFQQAVDNYREEMVRLKTDPKFIKHFSTFMGEWCDWIDFVPTAPPKNYAAERDGDLNAEIDAIMGGAS